MLSLEEFTDHMGQHKWSQAVKWGGFSYLYVRRNHRFIDGQKVENCLTVANMTAYRPGTGNFRRLERFLLDKGLSILVERVQTPELIDHLVAAHYRQVNQDSGIHFYKESPRRLGAKPTENIANKR